MKKRKRKDTVNLSNAVVILSVLETGKTDKISFES